MRIIISGYGKMGKEVEKAALKRKHQIIARIDNEEDWHHIQSKPGSDAIVIDFSYPETAVKNILRCFSLKLPIVTGTTGWYEKLEMVKDQCIESGGSLLFAPNFSIGVNLFFKANQYIAKLTSGIDEYKVEVYETHHIHKLDAPSGTAIRTAEDIIESHDRLKGWVNQATNNDEHISIVSKREGEITGAHEVVYQSSADTISLKHNAKNRSGFALGAILSAEFLIGKKGVFTMDDLLKF